MHSIIEAAAMIAAGAKPRALVEECLARIDDRAGEGARVFLKLHADEARAAADFYHRLHAAGRAPSPFAGIPISAKDLFDVAGDVTTAGSVILRDAPPAQDDAPAIARIPGGSSSGAAVSVTDGMAFGAIGTDTGGSCRIPAALCGIVGFKPTAHRVPTQGAFPLSTSLDSIGPLTATVECAAVLDAVLAGEPIAPLQPFPVQGLRLAVPQTMVLDNVEPAVSGAFDAALTLLRKAGAVITDIPLREFSELPQINAKGGLSAAESYAIHRPLLAKHAKRYDPRVLARILRGQEQDAADYIDLVKARADFIRRIAPLTAPYDALVMPTVPVIAPRLAELAADDAYRHTNALVLRNPSIANFLDRCAISIPCHRAGDAPVGLMLIGEHDADRRLLAIAAGIEKVVAPRCA